jgi:hypothetical protein
VHNTYDDDDDDDDDDDAGVRVLVMGRVCAAWYCNVLRNVLRSRADGVATANMAVVCC